MVARRHRLAAPLLQDFNPQEMIGSTAGCRGTFPSPPLFPRFLCLAAEGMRG